MKYFFDTYAIIELIKNSESYLAYNKYPLITSTFNVSETYYFFLEYFGRSKADYIFSKLNINILEVDKDVAIKASIFRHENKKLKLSYADCIGYCLAKSYNMKFLTGDDGFKNIENVEFVK
jgi:predicted nucleic acid-binding protein